MRSKPLTGRLFPRFSGIKTFFRLPYVEVGSTYDVALFGVPYDGAVSYRPGARFGPTRVREYSSLGRGYHWTRGVNFLEKLQVVDVGDTPTAPVDQQATMKKITDFTSEVLASPTDGQVFKSTKFIAIGGDHSNTLSLLRGVAKKYGPVRLIHFDAHLDTYPAAWGCDYHHGTFVRHAVHEKLIRPELSWQFGIRGPLAGVDDLDFIKTHKLNTTTVDDVRMQGLEKFVSTIPAFDDDVPTYISFDIDCLDPAYAPGTGTPVPGGLTTYEAQRILRTLKIKNLVAADVVEVSPPFDTAGITCLAALDVGFEMLVLMSSAA